MGKLPWITRGRLLWQQHQTSEHFSELRCACCICSFCRKHCWVKAEPYHKVVAETYMHGRGKGKSLHPAVWMPRIAGCFFLVVKTNSRSTTPFPALCTPHWGKRVPQLVILKWKSYSLSPQAHIDMWECYLHLFKITTVLRKKNLSLFLRLWWAFRMQCPNQHWEANKPTALS